MPASNPPPGCFSSMPNGPFVWSPHKTENLTGEPGCISSHLRSAAGTVICFVVIIYLISLSIDLANNGLTGLFSWRNAYRWKTFRINRLISGCTMVLLRHPCAGHYVTLFTCSNVQGYSGFVLAR